MEEYFYASPVGTIRLLSEADAITGLFFIDKQCENTVEKTPALALCEKELDEYFAGERKIFTVKTKIAGTAFTERCWRFLLTIPYGETRTYSEEAAAAGSPRASRAAGGANHNNKISIIYPCHRVVGVNGSLTGYGGGLWRKEWLLRHEKKYYL